jgi:hypothetical protein
MPASSSNNPLDEAFELLRSTVVDLHSAGRRIYAAGLKPELKRRSYGGFDEKSLNGGFVSFKRFLEAAHARGLVDLTPAPVGPDVLVTPQGAQPQDVAVRDEQRGSVEIATARSSRFVRRDLWRAFIDWREDEVRIYDSKTHTVLRFPAAPAPLEPPEQAERRRLWQTEPARFHQITPIATDRQLEWMRAFAAGAVEPMRTALVLALSNEKPFRAFSLAARVDPATNAQWQTERLRHVVDEIESWAQQSNLEVRIFEPPLSPATAGGRTVPPGKPPGTQPREDEVRRRLHAAVDRMPLSALYALSLPVEYLIDG